MIKWKQFSESSPDNRGMCLVCLPSCQITQSYYSEGLFYEPWGEVFPESKQPKWWTELNWPIMNGSGEEA